MDARGAAQEIVGYIDDKAEDAAHDAAIHDQTRTWRVRPDVKRRLALSMRGRWKP
jgi:hypothetical protein